MRSLSVLFRSDRTNSTGFYFQRAAQWYSAVARRGSLAVLVPGLLVLLIRASLLPVLPFRYPEVHDEFSYLLAADTFASGRLTNPTHPMWMHFETMHVNHRPTYMSKYPPAQGLALAAGQVIGGHPWWGVWFSVALMCSALCWMLRGWLAPGWALLGGLLAVVRFGVMSYWINSYWGGAVAAIGGALVLGAFPRVVHTLRPRDAALMGVGAVVLMNSRPYEGLVLCLPLAGYLFVWATGKMKVLGESRPAFAKLLRRSVLPFFAVFLAGALWTGYYCWRVTGSPFRMPYQVHRETYEGGEFFYWEAPRPSPLYRHKVMRDFYVGWEQLHSEQARTLPGFALHLLDVTWVSFLFYLGPGVGLLIVSFGQLWRSPGMRILLLVGSVFVVGLLLTLFYSPHYAAPATGLFFALSLCSARMLWDSLAPQTNVQRCIAGVVVGGSLLLFAAVPEWVYSWTERGPGLVGRACVLDRLAKMNGQHLVIVRYAPDHNELREWVYNRADIDRAKVVWAREMDPASDEALIQYFKGRHVWLLEADKKPLTLQPWGRVSKGVRNRSTAPPGPVIVGESDCDCDSTHSRVNRLSKFPL